MPKLLFRFLALSLFGLIQPPHAVAQNEKRATVDDLNAMVSTWNALVKPGEILQTQPGEVLFILSEDGVEALHRSKNTASELVRQQRAVVETSVVQVRVLGSIQGTCFSLRLFHVACSTVPDMLAGGFKELSSPPPTTDALLVAGVTKEQYATHLVNLKRQFANRDLSNFVNGGYAFVRILNGNSSGVQAYVQLRHLTKATGPPLVATNSPMVIKAETIFDFRQTRWGMSKAQVIAIEGKPIIERPDRLMYQTEVAGIKAAMSFDFLNGKLARAAYILTETYLEPNQYIMSASRWASGLSEKYGESKSKIEWLNDLYRKDEKRTGFAVSAGHLIIRDSWETERTKIQQIVSGKNFEITVGIHYVSKELESALAKKAKEAEKTVF